MKNKLFQKIKEYNTIIVQRHTRPDLDAIGSQLGLKEAIKFNFPEKEVYAVGDRTSKYDFIGTFDEIPDSKYDNALVIICDVSVANMVSDERYKLAKEVFVIDHHHNPCDITENWLCKNTASAAAEYIAELLKDEGYKFNADIATYFYAGIVTDSGRFMYGGDLANTLAIASFLVSQGARYKFVYDNIYVDSLEDRKMSAYFQDKVVYKDNIAYIKSDKDVFEKFPVEFNDISRGMLSLMSGLREIVIWLNFTYDESRDVIVGEFRSRTIPIVDIAKAHGGGGHLNACGASLKSWEEVDEINEEYYNLAKQNV